jgi:hypothetical protein
MCYLSFVRSHGLIYFFDDVCCGSFAITTNRSVVNISPPKASVLNVAGPRVSSDAEIYETDEGVVTRLIWTTSDCLIYYSIGENRSHNKPNPQKRRDAPIQNRPRGSRILHRFEETRLGPDCVIPHPTIDLLVAADWKTENHSFEQIPGDLDANRRSRGVRCEVTAAARRSPLMNNPKKLTTLTFSLKHEAGKKISVERMTP